MATMINYATKNRHPNFFIIGAPKAGTTSLSEYLRLHPNVFFSNPKEPHYFNDDFKVRHTYDYNAYLTYFDGVLPKHKAVGEGSIFYLYSKTAVSNILNLYNDAKFVVMLRNPIDLVYSWHSQAIHSFGETVTNFDKAWDLQELRKNGISVPRINRVKEALYYGELAKLGEQVDRLLQQVNRKYVHFIIFDDFKKNTLTEYLKVLIFLNLEKWIPESFTQYNANKYYKNIMLKKVLDLVTYINKKSGLKNIQGLGLLKKLKNWNTTFHKRDRINKTFRAKLVKYFHDDVKLLSKLINRNLDKEWGFTK